LYRLPAGLASRSAACWRQARGPALRASPDTPLGACRRRRIGEG
jgi:hypothetical protein